MRLKIKLKAKNLVLPASYQHLLQGAIYRSLSGTAFGKDFHDSGLSSGSADKNYKLFVFSNLRGKYEIEGKKICFIDSIYFYVASYSPEFIEKLYEYFISQHSLRIGDQWAEIVSVFVEEPKWFQGIKTIHLDFISPVTAYRTKEKKVTYFSPEDPEFEILCLENLNHKNQSLKVPFSEIDFRIVEAKRIKKRVLHFKNTFYIGYTGSITIEANYPAFMLIYNTGLSAKGSSGFGMVQGDYE